MTPRREGKARRRRIGCAIVSSERQCGAARRVLAVASLLFTGSALQGTGSTLQAQEGTDPGAFVTSCTVLRADAGVVLLQCPDVPTATGVPAIVSERCLARTGDAVLAQVGPHPPIVLRNTTAAGGSRCFGYYKVAVEGGCEGEYYCKARDSWDRISCAKCGWIEERYCDGRLKKRTGESCALCDGRRIPAVVRGPQEGWGDGIPWETVVGRRYLDRCGLHPVPSVDESRRQPRELSDLADHLRSVWNSYSGAESPAGPEAQAAAAQAHDMLLYDYLVGLSRMKSVGRPVALVKDRLARIDEELTRDPASPKRESLERQRKAWMAWSTPERLELLAEHPDAVPDLLVAVETRSALSPEVLAALTEEQRAQFGAGPPLPPELRGEPAPGGPSAADAAYLWENWDEYREMVLLIP